MNDQCKLKADMKLDGLPEAALMPLDGSSHTDIHVALPFTREDYFDLVDAIGHIIREDKSGFIPSEIPPRLLRLGIKPHKWLEHVKNFSRRYGHCAGSVVRMQNYAIAFDKRWVMVNAIYLLLGEWQVSAGIANVHVNSGRRRRRATNQDDGAAAKAMVVW